MRLLQKGLNACSPDATRASLIWFFCLLLSMSFCVDVRAERQPFKNYTTADGLAHDNVTRIVRDSRGFLWFCTGEGLSRFDGYNFKNYTQANGLPHRVVNDLLELPGGNYLIATNNGLVLFDPLGVSQNPSNPQSAELPMFRVFRPSDAKPDKKSFAIDKLLMTRDGKLWAGTMDGLYRIERNGDDLLFNRFEPDTWRGKSFEFTALFEDRTGALWIGTIAELYRLTVDGYLEEMPDQFGVRTVLEDPAGHILTGSSDIKSGLRLYTLEDAHPVLTQVFTTLDGLSANAWISDSIVTSNGQLWVGTGKGLDELLPKNGTAKPKFRQALPGAINSICEDGGGNLWVGTAEKGAFKLARRGFTLFDQTDGVPSASSSIFAGTGNEIFVSSGELNLLRFDGEKFSAVKPFGMESRNWSSGQTDFRSAFSGEWWIPTFQGLRRYPPVARFEDLAGTIPIKVYTKQDGIFTDLVFRAFEDSRGDVWIGVIGDGSETPNVLSRWELATGKIHGYTTDDGLPRSNGATAYGEDSAGNVWFGFYYGGVARYRQGRFDFYKPQEDFPLGIVNAIHRDRQGRLWFASGTSGLVRVDDPTADKPRFDNLTTVDGLSSNQATCLAEDHFGRIYVGTGRGINRLDPETGRIKIYTQADGLPGSLVRICRGDSAGNLWFGQQDVLARLSPQPEEQTPPPPIFISDLRVNGAAVKKLSELGETSVENLDFDSSQRQIQVDFFALGFGTAETLRYQYKLDGFDTTWSEPGVQRTVNLNLSSGAYRFLVRAVSSDGVTSEHPAVVSFTIRTPVWQRWWFIALAAIIITGLIFSLDRFRVAKTKQVENALDVSRKSEKAAHEGETRYRTLAETASDAIITIDETSRIVYVNEAVEKIFGYSPREMIGEYLTMVMPEELREQHKAGLGRYLKTNRKSIAWAAVELPGQHKSGARIPLELSFGEFEKDGHKFFTGIARDITERKKSEAALQRSREERLAELERVRSRIARDLHDDIGSSLTQITLYSELAKASGKAKSAEPLRFLVSISNELVEAMSDIVWAINPLKDHLHDLAQRMRRFAAESLTLAGIDLEFSSPEADTEMGANLRREVFLIFKESVNNIVKHSGATIAEVTFSLKNGVLNLSLKDNGCGFEATENGQFDWQTNKGGNGLSSMHKRAVELGGSLLVNTKPGAGTTIVLSVPLNNQPTENKHLTRMGNDSMTPE